jgi:hypothetical protein
MRGSLGGLHLEAQLVVFFIEDSAYSKCHNFQPLPTFVEEWRPLAGAGVAMHDGPISIKCTM